MPSSHVDSLVDDYLHDLLSPDDAKRVERHCAECAGCRDALEAARARWAALRAVPPCEPSEQLIQRTISRLQSAPLTETSLAKNPDKDAAMPATTQPAAGKPMKKRSPWHRRIWLTLACAATLAAVAIGVMQSRWQNYKPSPYDLRILGQNQLLEGAPINLRLAIFDRDQKQFAGNMPVTVALVNRETRRVISETQVNTVADGPTYVSFEPPAEARGEFDLVVKAQTINGQSEELKQVVTIRRAVRLMLSCDKPVYQPGQTIHVRSLTLRRPDLKPVQNEPATFTVFDTNSNAIFKKSMPTSKFGIAAADCQLATEILEGTYRIQCQVGEEFSERTVEVRKYVLPKFKLSLTLDKPFYQPGETISGTLDAAYFFGKPVAEGVVKLQLLTSDVEAANVLEEKTEKTDSEGKLPFTFKLPDQLVGQEQAGGDATIRIAAQVTDTAGQSQATLATRTVTSQAIHLSVIPEAGRFVPEVTNKVYVFASYPDGQPVKNGKVTIGDKTAQTSELGVAAFELEGQKPDITFTLEISASDDAGRSIRQSMAFATGPAMQDYVLRPDRPIYDGGETMNLEALGGGSEPVFVDLLKDGQSLLSKTIDMKDGRGELAIDLPAEISGAIELWSYRFLPSGVAERKSRLVLIRPAADLKITAALDREEHRPGEKAQMNFQLVDADGKPTPGAISVAVVDEAVFSVLSQSSGLPELFFMLDEELLQPVYAVYEQWSPLARGDVAEEVREEFDAAMFSLTSRTSSEPDDILKRFAQGDEALQTNFGPGVPMMEPMMMVEEIKMPGAYMPGQMTTPFNLTAATYRGKAIQAEQERQQGLRATRIAWGAWTIAICLGLVASVAIYAPRIFLWGAAGLGVLAFFAAAGIGVLWIVLPADRFETLAKGAAEMAPMAMMGEGMEPMEAMMMAMDAGGGMLGGSGPEPIRVRSEFPETLLWLPELVTDDAGKVSLDIPLADSITTWRLSAAAVSGEGQLGSGEFPIRVFQPFFVDFNLPVALTRNDEAAIPIVVYNYLDTPQTVTLNLKQASWFERMEGDPNAELTIELGPREIKSTSVRLKVLEVGRQQLEITARGGDIADAIRREIDVVPDGRRVDESYAGRIEGQVDYPIELPAERIPGSTKLIVKVYPATFTQLVEGLDSIFQMPHGCFEQTSSTTYPSVLALDYLKRMQKSSPAVEAKARQYIHIGYQRLLSFEIPGGGFDWFGRPPANRTLTAYGLMEFDDMARVHDVDPALLESTRNWLLSQRQADGTWAAEPHMLDDGLAGAVNRTDFATLASTAYIAWAVFGDGKHGHEAGGTLDFLVKQDPSQIEDPYILAVTLSAIAAIRPDHASIKIFADRLEALKQNDPGKKHTWWEKPGQSETVFCGSGVTAHVETTAMATLALMATKEHKGSVQEALAWLTTQKVEGGTWGSTQATVLALKALLSGIDQGSDGKERRLELAIDGERVEEIVIAPDQFDVVQQVDLTKYLEQESGDRGQGTEEARSLTVSLRDKSDTAPAYQLALRYHVPGEPETMPQEPLTIKIAYDRQQLAVNDRIAATATVVNNLDRPAPMVILDLPIPGGFVMEPGELEELVGHGIERFQVTNRKAIVYLRDLPPGTPLELKYRLKATMPVKVTVPQAEAYQYYTPERRGQESEERVFVVGDA